MTTVPIDSLPSARRLALGLFLATILGFYLLAQVKVVTAVGSGGGYPGPREVLHRYHGDPTRTVMHKVLDPSLAADDPKRMFPYLGATEEECEARRRVVLAWAEAGAPERGWRDVAPIFGGETTCGLCHSRRPDAEGRPRARSDLPLDTYADAVSAARLDTGMSLHELATSSHNHMFGFAVGALLVAWAFTGTRWRGPIVPVLVGGATLGAVTDVSSWWLTKAHGHPFQYGVIAGGALFGGCLTAMAVLALDAVWFRSTLARGLAPALRTLRLGRLEPRAES